MNKILTRYCLKRNKKIEDLKECCNCSDYKKKDLSAENLPEINLSKEAITVGFICHIKYHSCSYSQYYDEKQMTEKSDLPKAIKKLNVATKNFLKKQFLKSDNVKSLIIAEWYNIVGKAFCENIKVLKFSRGTLIVQSDNPSVSQDFLFVQKEVIDNINNILQDRIVKKIKIQH
ncbi:MAG TPA: DUF721 domain-containing protein [bacterium]|nr:DUF721 domain-containing protein [bacterium]